VVFVCKKEVAAPAWRERRASMIFLEMEILNDIHDIYIYIYMIFLEMEIPFGKHTKNYRKIHHF